MAALSEQDEIFKIKISQRMKELREGTGLTQSQFSARHLIDRQTLNRWENGRGVTIYTINRFSIMVSITLTEFFDHSIFK
ncbi:MAG TPA: XRE family transcriptional regulator [Leeuwenhoekiella sp.]|nr:XRE family transcriptional regulator [Leeuwenhoekiella sp.]